MKLDGIAPVRTFPIDQMAGRSNATISLKLAQCLTVVALLFNAAWVLAQSVSGLQLVPSTVAGGSGAAATGIVTLSAPAPSGGTLVNLSSDLPGLASPVPQVRVAAGQTSAQFQVGTNALYRRYSALAFATAIRAVNPSSGASVAATLNVTAQARPNITVLNPRPSLFSGPRCLGDPGILFNCSLGLGVSCTFQQECLLGCQTRQASGTTYRDQCATSGRSPVAVVTPRVVGGERGTGTVQMASAAPTGSYASVSTGSLVAAPTVRTLQSIATGALNQNFELRTAAVAAIQFSPVDVVLTTPQALSGGGVFLANRHGRNWIAVSPGAAPAPNIVSNVVETPVLQGGQQGIGTACVDQLAPLASVGSIPLQIESANVAVVQVNASALAVGSDCLSYSLQTAPVTSNTSVAVIARLGAQALASQVLVSATPMATAANAMFLDPVVVNAGTSSNATLILNGMAPAGGFFVSLSTNFPNVVVPPASVTVPAGTDRVNFTIQTLSNVASETAATIFAHPSVVTARADLIVRPAGVGSSLAGLSVVPSSLIGGNGATLTVALTSTAPAGGITVNLASNSPAVLVPSSVVVPAGTTSAGFPISTAAVSSNTVVTLTASLGTSTATTSLTVATSGGGALAAPSLASPANDARFDSGQVVSFNWSDVVGAVRYQIQVDESNGFTAPLVLSQTPTLSEYAIANLPVATLYWRVRALDVAGVAGPWSTVRQLRVR